MLLHELVIKSTLLIKMGPVKRNVEIVEAQDTVLDAAVA